MEKLRRKIYMTAGYNTISLGTGRKEFHPKKPRPGIDHYIQEAGRGALAQIAGAEKVDEGVIGNFMAERFNKQGHLNAFFAAIDEQLNWKPVHRVEGACASGGLALTAGIRSILAETAEVVLAIGVEVQNTMKAIYGADVLAGAGWFQERKTGHAYYFPGKFSDRAGAYFEKYGREKTRKAFARWYRNAIENARLCPTAQEYHNTTEDLETLALTEPNPKMFVEHLNVFDCSKVSDGASAMVIVSATMASGSNSLVWKRTVLLRIRMCSRCGIISRFCKRGSNGYSQSSIPSIKPTFEISDCSPRKSVAPI